jgi:hypothetical protein
MAFVHTKRRKYLTNKDDPKAITQPIKLGSKLNRFHQQVTQGAKEAERIASAPSVASFADMSSTVIFPDCSGSMGEQVGNEYGSEHHDKSFYCRQAVDTFLDNCFAGATKVGLASFPELVVLEPTHDLVAVRNAAKAIEPTGSTPMHEPLEYVIDNWPCTHGIIISDGSPDDKPAVIEAAKAYKERNIKLDAVHIGSDIGGEDLMKQVAGLTGGIYIKFTNVAAFAA